MKNRTRRSGRARKGSRRSRGGITRGPSSGQQQAVPNEYIAWLTLVNQGDIAAGSSSGSYQIELNDIVHPLNTTDPLPNLVNNAAGWDPTGLQNLLYNTATSTGLYFYYRVLASKITLSVQPTTITDVMDIALAPTNQGGVYGQFTTAASGPQGKKLVATTNNNTRSNTLHLNVNVKKIVGIKELAGATFTPATDGSYSNAPTNNMLYSINWYTRANLSTPVQYWVEVQYKVYFFGRVDTPLLESVKLKTVPPNVTRLIGEREPPSNKISNSNNELKEDYVEVKTIDRSLYKELLKLLALTSQTERVSEHEKQLSLLGGLCATDKSNNYL